MIAVIAFVLLAIPLGALIGLEAQHRRPLTAAELHDLEAFRTPDPDPDLLLAW